MIRKLSPRLVILLHSVVVSLCGFTVSLFRAFIKAKGNASNVFVMSL